MKTNTAPAPAKPRRLEDMSSGRGGHFRFTLDQLTIPEGYNPRTEFHGIPELAESILAESTDELVGLLNPLRVRKVKGTEIIEVLDGERRIRAIRHLAAQGHTIGLIPCIPEQQGTTDLQRDLVPLVANTGQELTFLEKARQYKRLIERHGIKPAELARRCQTTKQAVSDALRLVNEATPLLLSYVAGGKMSGTTALAIIKQAQASGQSIDTLATLTEQAADAAGSDHITPKHIPTPDPLAAISFTLHKEEPGSFLSLGKDKHLGDIFCRRALCTNGLSSRQKFNIGWAWADDGTWSVGYHCSNYDNHRTETKSAVCADTNGGLVAQTFADLTAGIRWAVDHAAGYFKWEPEFTAAFTDKALQSLSAKDLRNSKMKKAATDPADSESTQPDLSSEASAKEESPTHPLPPSPPPSFVLYQIEDAPTDLIKGTSTRHETDRLVLTNAPDSIGLLHLLVAPTPNGLLSFGYRLNETEYLPDCNGHLSSNIEDGLRRTLDAALEGYDIHPEDSDAIADALFNALCDYYPEEGEAKQPETLAFTPPGQVPDPNTGYQGILNAPSSNHDGSALGKGQGGYSAPDKQLEKIERLLEDLDEKGIGFGVRITTTEIILGVLRNERPIADLRKHLEGK